MSVILGGVLISAPYWCEIIRNWKNEKVWIVEKKQEDMDYEVALEKIKNKIEKALIDSVIAILVLIWWATVFYCCYDSWVGSFNGLIRWATVFYRNWSKIDDPKYTVDDV